MAHHKQWNNESDLPKKKFSKESWAEFRWMFGYIKPYKSIFILGLFILACATLPSLFFPKMTGILTNVAIGTPTQSSNALDQYLMKIFNSIGKVCLFLLAMTVFQSVFSFIRVWLFSIISEKTMADLRRDIYNKILGLPYPFFENNRVGEIHSRITADVTQLQDTISISLAELLRGLTTLLGGLLFIFITIPIKLSLLMISIIPVFAIAAVIFAGRIRKLSKLAQDELASSNVIVDETLHAIQTVKVYTNERYESNRYKVALMKNVRIALQAARFRGAFLSFIIGGFFGGIVIILWYGFHLIQQGQMTIGDLIAFMMYSIFIGGSIGGMSELYTQFQKSLGASERLRMLLTEEIEIDVSHHQKNTYTEIKGKIQFEHVKFSYASRPDITVLKNVSFTINENSKVAFAGPSGAGKSTIMQLLLQFYKNYEGQILIDGKNIKDIPLTILRQHMALVPQEIILFGGSIRENIAYSKLDASDEEIWNAASQANAAEFIQNFPDGLNTIVGERGIKLSGGQRQRIAIARAILKNPAILILDEATSSLDAKNEVLVQDALQKLMHGRTTIIIAHRLSTIKDADHIYVLKNGYIIQSGTFIQLTEDINGVFHDLIKIQKELYN